MITLLFSGGVDSMTLAHEALASGALGALLFFRYGQPAEGYEARAVAEWRRRHAPQVRLIDATLSIGAAPMTLGSGVPGPRVLPGRNLLMLAHGIAVAAQSGHRAVWYGAQGGDAADYPDCRPPFVAAVNTLAQQWEVSVEAPLLHLSKWQVIERAQRAGVDLRLAWSCYEPRDGEPCGTCNACAARRIG